MIILPFSDNLRALRLAHNLTQKDIGALAGVTPITISSYESGKSVPTMHQLIAIADVLNVSLDALVGREPATVNTDPLCVQIHALTDAQREDVEKYINFIRSKE